MTRNVELARALRSAGERWARDAVQSAAGRELGAALAMLRLADMALRVAAAIEAGDDFGGQR